MPNNFFQFKQFTVQQGSCAMKVTTDSCLFGAWAAAEIQYSEYGAMALDAGTGTGLLSLMVAQKNRLQIDAVEIEKEAAQQAEENVALSPWTKRITVINTDLLQWRPGKKYDIIIANPPFYEGDLPSPNIIKNRAHHQESLGLNSLLRFIKNHLNTVGHFYLLLPYKRWEELKKAIECTTLCLHKTVVVKPATTHPPSRLMVQGALYKNNCDAEREISIKKDGRYTPDFIALLKDYYLCL